MDDDRPIVELPKHDFRIEKNHEPIPILILGIVIFVLLQVISWEQSSERTVETAAASAMQARLNTVIIISAEYQNTSLKNNKPIGNKWQRLLQDQTLPAEKQTILTTANFWRDASIKATDQEYSARTAGNAAALFGLAGQLNNARRDLLSAEKKSPHYSDAYRELLPIYATPANSIEISPQVNELLQQLSAGSLIRARNAELAGDEAGKISALRSGHSQGRRVLLVSSTIMQVALLLLLSSLTCWFIFHNRIKAALYETAVLKRRPPIWGIGTALIVISLVYGLTSLLAGIIRVGLVVFGNMTDAISQITLLSISAVSLIVSTIVVIGFFLLLIGQPFFQWSVLGWRHLKTAWLPSLLVLFISYPIILAMTFISSKIFADKLDVNPILPILQSTTNPLQIAMILFIIVVMAPVIEETLFRGLLFPALNIHFSFWMAALISGVVFAVFHNQLGALLPIAALGTVFAFLYRRSNNLWAPAVAHAAFNAVSTFIAMMLGWALR